MAAYIVPCFVLFVFVFALFKKVNVFTEFGAGAREGIKTSFDILPSLILLMTAIAMFKASGALSFLTELVSPVTSALGFPSEVIPLALFRPLSGSGALSCYEQLLADYSPDSFIGRLASVMMGSTETTFYVTTVYFSAIGVSKSRHTIPAALSADIFSFILSAFFIRLIF